MGPVVIAIAVLVTLIIAVPVTAVVAISYRKKVVETKIGNADEKARQIVDDALKVAETKKREALLEVKEESLKTKNELERETKERRAELQRYEKRVLSKVRNKYRKGKNNADGNSVSNSGTLRRVPLVVQAKREPPKFQAERGRICRA